MDKDKQIPSAGRSRGRGRASNPQQPTNGGRGRRPAQLSQPGGGFQAAPPPTTSAWGQPAAAQPQPAAAAPATPSAWAQTTAPPPASVWGQQPVRRPAAAPAQAAGISAPQPQPSFSAGAQQRPPAPAAQGRATSHRDAPPAEAGAQGGAQVVKEDTRGSVRGKRVITEIIRSRPRELVTKCGTTGTKVSVQTNYFRVLKKPKWSVYQYRVDFSPDVDMIRLRRAYLAHHKALFGGYIFDGTILFCTTYFGDQMVNGMLELLTKNREGETIQIKVKHVGVVDATDVQQMQVLNLILRRAMEGLNLQLVGRNFYDPVAKILLDSYRLEIWPGYTTSIRQHEQDVLLCAEIAHKVMRTESVYTIMQQCIRDSGDYQSAFKREVVGTIVLTGYNNKTYRVDDIDFSASPLSTFSTKDGDITYVEYYKRRHNIHIQDTNQPMLVSRPTERNIRGGQNEFIMLVPEISRATGMTDEMRNNFRLMRAMADHTRLNPERRIDRLRTFNRRLQNSQASVEVLKSWNLQLDTNLVEVPGRVLPPTKIVFGANMRYQCDDRADWTQQFRKNSMYSHVDIKRWYVITPRRNVREVQEFVKMCVQAARGMKMQISEPRYEEMPDDRNGTYSQAIDTAASKDPQILMLVLVNNNEEKYSCIKKKCCVDRPVPSQVVTLRTIAPRGDKAGGLMSVATKVVIQMNAKLMGAPWMIEVPVKGLMTVGFDVCHSAKEKNKSYGALVATMDMRTSTRYYSAVTQHLKGQELSNEVSMNMTYALKAYRETHGALPERILFFRDGVGDGQLHQVVNTEVQYLKQKLEEIYKSAGVETGCRMAFVVVSKRINTRYFVNRQNPVPGTVVDDIITLPERYDFFLVSQSVRQGTVSPTSYNVIYDTMGLDADKLQMLTYKMTHMYFNWSGTCRVPAVCQYAHKLAFLVAESIHRAPNNSLENQLYFL